MQYKKIIISLLFISQINMGMEKNNLDIYRPEKIQITTIRKPIDELIISVKYILEIYKPEEIQTFITIDRKETYRRKQQMSLLLKEGIGFIHTIQQAILDNKKTTIEKNNDNITTKAKKKRPKKKQQAKPQTKNSSNKKTKYTLPNLPVPPTNTKPIVPIKPIKSTLQQIIRIKRTLIKDNNASNEAELKSLFADFCDDQKVPCMSRTFNNTIRWHYDKKDNELSFIFNNAPTTCGYDHSSEDSSSD